MHIGFKNGNFSYKTCDVSEEYVWKIQLCHRFRCYYFFKLKMGKSSKCSCSKSTMSTYGYILRIFTYFDAEMVKNFYITFVRPHLEF